MRCSVVPVSPNMRSNVTRGLMATGSGLVSSRHESVLKNVHGKPSHAPTAVPMSSVPSSIERSGVSPATASAMYWSTVFFDWILPNASLVPSRCATGPMPLRNAELAPRWTEAPHGARILLTVTSWSRNGSSGCMTGLNSKPVPTSVGCQVSGNTPFGM